MDDPNVPVERPAPNMFSNHPENWIARKTAHSLFLVEVDIRHKAFSEAKPTRVNKWKEVYKHLAKRAKPEPKDGKGQQGDRKNKRKEMSQDKGKGIADSPPAAVATPGIADPPPAAVATPQQPHHKPEDEEKIVVGTRQRYSTGFVIAKAGHNLKILTCAHTIPDVYNAGCHNVTREKLNLAFSFQVLCIHQEHEVATRPHELPVSLRNRTFTAATVIAVDTARDLLALHVDAREIRLDGREMCCFDHPAIPLAKEFPSIRDGLLLQGWPPQRPRANAGGKVSFNGRSYDAVCDVESNLKGYSMRLMEIPELVRSNGYSGGPLLDGNSHCVGVYHGVMGKEGYAISLPDIRDFCNRNHVLT